MNLFFLWEFKYLWENGLLRFGFGPEDISDRVIEFDFIEFGYLLWRHM